MIRVISASILSAIFMIGASSAQAATAALFTQNVSFQVDSRPGTSGRVYYNCDSVEGQIESMLEQMGAVNIQVSCTGGIDSHRPQIAWDASVDATFDTLHPVRPGTPGAINAAMRSVQIHEWDSCYLLNQAFQEVAPSFALQNVVGPRSCSSMRSAFRVELESLFP